MEWKNINQKFKNDFDKALEYILSALTAGQRAELTSFADKVLSELISLDLGLLGKKVKPPIGY